MSTERHHRLSEIFAEASRLAPGERVNFLDTACGDDPELRAEVDRLLAADQHALRLDPDPAWRSALWSAVDSPDGDHPQQIGPYRVMRLLGTGGMGAVYEAEAANPRRLVAVKVLAHADLQGARRARFEREAEALARLDHPGTARIHDVGIAADGRPYLVMELVRGQPLSEFLGRESHEMRSRLELFCRICDAVEAAHRAGIIHRDIKPQNILVVLDDDGSVRPKLLDFGVARLLDRDFESLTLRTEIGQLLGTLPYMSPEQITGRSDQVDARTDVYALGVLLYEMLAGRVPLDVRDRPLPEASRIVLEELPPRLGSVATRCCGDLETIAATALAKLPADRYPSAHALATDVRRYLDDLPILARPPSPWLQLRRLVRRHRTVAVGTAVAFLGLLVALGLVWRHARSLAEIGGRSAMLVGILDRLLAMADTGPFELSGTRQHVGPATTLGQVLGSLAAEIDTTPIEDAALEVQIRRRIGAALMSTGLWREGRGHLERALALAGPNLAPSGNTQAIQATIAWHDMLSGDVVRGAQRGQAVLQELERQDLAGSESWCSTAIATAWSLLMCQEGPTADELVKRVLQLAPERALVARSWARVVQAQNLVYEGFEARASSLLAALLSDLARIPGDHFIRTAASYAMAMAAARRGAAEEQLASVLASRAELERMVGPGENDLTDHWLLEHSAALTACGRAEDGIRLLQSAVPRMRERLGLGNPRAIMVMIALGRALARAGCQEEVLHLFRQWRDGGRTADLVPGLAALHHVDWASMLATQRSKPLAAAPRSADLDALLAETRQMLQPWVANPPTESGFEREALTQAAHLFLRCGEPELARQYADAAVAAWRQRGDTQRRVFLKSLAAAAKVRSQLGDVSGAEVLRSEIDRIYHDSGMDIPLDPGQWGRGATPTAQEAATKTR